MSLSTVTCQCISNRFFARTVELQASLPVSSNSGVLPGLDNGAAQAGEDGTNEQGEAQLSASESGDPKPQAPDSIDRACEGSLPAVSKREKRRLRREKERRAVEKMVEDILTSGNYSPGDIFKSVLAMALSGGGGP